MLHNRRRRLILPLCFLTLVFGIPAWLTYRQIRQEQLNRTLIAAIKQRNDAAAIAALEKGAEANTQDLPPNTRLLWQHLLDSLLNRKPQTPYGPTALMLALNFTVHTPYDGDVILPANPALIQALLDKGATINVKDSTGRTPLILAVASRQESVVPMLLQKHARFAPADVEGHLALLAAIANGEPNSVTALLNMGADPNMVDTQANFGYDGLTWNYTQRPALVCAVGAGRDEASAQVLKALLDKGAALNGIDNQGRTALMWSVFYGNNACIRLLLKRGADINHRDKKGQTALSVARQVARRVHNPTAITLLQQAGAKE